MISAAFLRQLENSLGKKFKSKLHIRRVTPVSGGSINLTARVDTNAGLFFMKVNDAFKFPGMFEKEAEGLDKLRSANCFIIPKLIHIGEEDGQAFLLMEFIESRAKSTNFWKNFGVSLATLHRNENEKFGFSSDNYIGSLRQSNRQHNKWIDFFIEERIEPLLKKAANTGLLNDTDNKNFQRLFQKLDNFIPPSPPSLIHGDLWSGNFMSDYKGEPSIFDPAVYYGHREMDLAMTRMFGGFDPEFESSYNESYPLEPGFDERFEIYNLYPLLVHVNLFGGAYVSQVRQILKGF
jgi:protein-ribulosamine 3-kinase